MNLNKVMIAGRVTRELELRYTPKGTPVVEISVAINRFFTSTDGQKKEETTFVDVTLWARQAEIAQRYLHKGSPVFIEGRLQYDTWEENGQKRSRLRVVAENMQLLERPISGQSSPQAPRAPSVQPSRPPAPANDPDLDVEAPF